MSSRNGAGGQDEGLLLISVLSITENKLRMFYNIPVVSVFTSPKKSYSISSKDNFEQVQTNRVGEV